MANVIIEDGSLSELDFRLATTNSRPLGKVNNPPSRALLETAPHGPSRVSPVRNGSGVLAMIRKRVRPTPVIINRVKRLSSDGAAH